MRKSVFHSGTPFFSDPAGALWRNQDQPFNDKTVLLYPMLPDLQKGDTFWEVPRHRPFVLVLVACTQKLMCGALV